MKQVVTICTNGALKGLEHKGRCLDLKQFGKAVVERITLIEWDSENQGWYIRWASEDKRKWGRKELQQVENLPQMTLKIPLDENEPVLFARYENAVEAEVAAIQQRQIQGSD